MFQLMHKLNMEAPHKILVKRYLIQIAKNYNVPYELGSVVMVSGATASLELLSVFLWLKCSISSVWAFRAQGCGIAANSAVVVLWYILGSPSVRDPCSFPQPYSMWL